MFERRLHANDVSIGLDAYETWKPIAGETTDALALVWILFVQEDANRRMTWPVPKLLQVVAQLLNSPFAADRRKARRSSEAAEPGERTPGSYERGFQFNSSVMGAVVPSPVIELTRNRPSRATSY